MWAPALVLLVTGCVSTSSELWPPPAGVPTQDIIVSVDTWHAVISIPRKETSREASGARREENIHTSAPSDAEPSRFLELSADSFPLTPHPTRLLYEEWSYAEEAWYLEGRQGFAGVLRALFWPTAGVVEVGTHARPWSERTPDPPAEAFHFTLSDEGYTRLARYLEGSLDSRTPLRIVDGRAFYPARRAYSAFHQCHHYAARALRAAGLPVSSGWALTRSLFVAQLRRAEQMAPSNPPPTAPAAVD